MQQSAVTMATVSHVIAANRVRCWQVIELCRINYTGYLETTDDTAAVVSAEIRPFVVDTVLAFGRRAVRTHGTQRIV
jgi:hypothetical protein